MLQQVQKVLEQYADENIAAHSQRFFKTGPGEYAEGDQFIGVRVPVIRQVAKRYQSLTIDECKALLHSKIHEERLLALIILVNQFAKADTSEKLAIYRLYLNNTAYINNWDLVDSSAHQIIGGYLSDKNREPLYKLARSKSLWERRMAMIATYHFIKQDNFDDTLTIAEMLLNDTEDLIHKAVGWMLRETGNRNRLVEEEFLQHHYQSMPRTMLRYAIEKFPEALRQQYLKGTI